ncbi:hypothetical protein [Silicimonas algicola]|uniref:hypothetical protein n=1 Tax=Silicimonas algicola TaxID=1826607 RepID=UPI001F49CBD5|nr:hypothetical protein [Silicimonas algicola]
MILRFLDETLDGPRLRRADPTEHATESMLIAKENAFTTAGYIFVMNQNRDRRSEFNVKLLSLYQEINVSWLNRTREGFGFLRILASPKRAAGRGAGAAWARFWQQSALSEQAP